MVLNTSTLPHTFPTFNNPEKGRAFENIVGKGENAGDLHLLLFQQCFLPFPRIISIFPVTFMLSSTKPFYLDWPKNLSFWKALTLYLICQFYALPIQQQIKI